MISYIKQPQIFSLNQLKLIRYPWIYTFFIIIAEVITSHFIYWGLMVHLAILIALLIHAVYTTDKRLSDLLTAMSIAPLIRILGLSTPLVHFSQVSWFIVVSVPMFIAGLTVVRLQRLSAWQINLSPPQKKYLPLEAATIALAFPIGFLEYRLLEPNPMADPTFWAALPPALILIVNTGFLEEFIFRGLFQYNAEKWSGFEGIVLMSVLFGALHITNQVMWDAFLAGGVGFLFALVVRRTGSIWGVSIAHGFVNITLFLIAPHAL